MIASTSILPRIARFLPFLVWLPELRDKQTLRADLIAGLTVALVLIPQSMAYAQLAGLPAYFGLYAAFLPPMVAAPPSATPSAPHPVSKARHSARRNSGK